MKKIGVTLSPVLTQEALSCAIPKTHSGNYNCNSIDPTYLPASAINPEVGNINDKYPGGKTG